MLSHGDDGGDAVAGMTEFDGKEGIVKIQLADRGGIGPSRPLVHSLPATGSEQRPTARA